MLLLTLLLPAQDPQQPPQKPEQQPEDQGFKLSVSVNQVFLSVTARSYEGGFFKGLTKDDLAVYEDGVRQQIVNFTQEAVPISVVLLIDASGSTRDIQASIRRAAMSFAKTLGKEDRLAIIQFNHEPRLILDWTNDLERVQLALERIYAKERTFLYDALYVTFDDLLRDVEGKKAVILLTDGVDTGSTMSESEVLDLAVRSEAIVYVASKLKEYWAGAFSIRNDYYRRGLPVPAVFTDSYILDAKRSLDRFADRTGGRVLEAEAFSNLTEVYSSVAEELRNQYYISYIPSNRAQDGSWREIEVRPLKSGVTLKTRAGYFAPGPQMPANP